MVRKETKKSVSVFGKQIPSGVFVVILFFITLLGFVGYNAYLDYQDQSKFNNNETTVSTLMAYISNEFEVIDSADTSYCYESSRKFRVGPTICKYAVSFNVNGAEFASITASVESKTDVVAGYTRFHDNRTNFWTLSQRHSCSFSYNESVELRYELECSGYARNSYYPFRN